MKEKILEKLLSRLQDSKDEIKQGKDVDYLQGRIDAFEYAITIVEVYGE